jgi:hypothetical protein
MTLRVTRRTIAAITTTPTVIRTIIPTTMHTTITKTAGVAAGSIEPPEACGHPYLFRPARPPALICAEHRTPLPVQEGMNANSRRVKIGRAAPASRSPARADVAKPPALRLFRSRPAPCFLFF